MAIVRRAVRLAAAVTIATLYVEGVAAAQSAEQVAVIINETHDGSRRIGEHYVQRRSVPPSHVIHIRTTGDESIDRVGYVRTIEQPIAAALRRAGLQDRVLYLVLTKGIPLRIAGTTGQDGTLASVDSELTLLYRRMSGRQPAAQGSVENPYFLGTRPLSEARRFTHRDHDIYLVTRLDAFTVEEALALVDRGLSATTHDPPADAAGRIVLDQRGTTAARIGDSWMDEAGERLASAGHGARVVRDDSASAARNIDDVVGYFSWGSTDPQHRQRRVELGFRPGAIAASLVGSDARTFREPPAQWRPGANVLTADAVHAGTAESLIGDLIREGVTGAAGSVSDAYFAGSIRPQVLFPAYLAGFNLAEAYYLAMPSLSWRHIIIGDPLAAVAALPPLAAQDIETEVEPTTQLPGYFAARALRLALARAPGAPEAVIGLHLRAEELAARDDLDAARAALEEALHLLPEYPQSLMRLAGLDERAGRWESAMALYRRILDVDSKNVMALNNLAYALAVRVANPQEGLPLARRAATLAPSEPNVLDTLAWIHHLMDDDVDAVKVITQAVARSPESAIVYLHAAAIFAADGRAAQARVQLKEALTRDPSLADTDEARAVQAALEEPTRRE